MKWWHKVVVPLQRLWIAVAKRVGIRKTGQVKLCHDVRTCEYEDVHVLWEMLQRKETEPAGPGTKKMHFWNICVWARHAPYICR